jgi:pimeloyl-ACP methyl ester carboxylesterase
VLCLPRDGEAGGKRPAVLVVDEDGKQAAFERGLVDSLLSKEFAVLAIDYRGAGETSRTVPAIEYGPGTPEYNLTNYSLFIGRPLAGARVVDIRCATDFLANCKEVDADQIAIAGRGRGALSAVLAASFDERLACVAADELLTTWVFNEEFVGIDLAYMIPRILTVGDMPHLLAHVAPRPLLINNPVDGRRREVPTDDANVQLRYTEAVYDAISAEDAMHVSRDNTGAIARFLAERLQP